MKLIEDLGITSQKVTHKFIVEEGNRKIGVVVEKDLVYENWYYYKFIDGKFSYEELDENDLNESQKKEIEDIFREISE